MKLEVLNKRIGEQNKMFKKASPEQKRVIIVKDCIARIKLEQLKPDTGCFVNYEEIDSGDIKSLLEKNGIQQCIACAKGSLFLTYIGRVNSFSWEDFTPSFDDNYNELESVESQRLLEIFSAEQLVLIETAFEGYQVICNDASEEDFIDLRHLIRNQKPNYYKNKFEDAKDRLIHICENIIRNKGTFVWTNKTR